MQFFIIWTPYVASQDCLKSVGQNQLDTNRNAHTILVFMFQELNLIFSSSSSPAKTNDCRFIS
jgi:hypothetical protein